MCMNPGKRGRMVSADNGNGKERKRNRKAGTVLCTQMEDRTVSFYIKEWVQNRKEPGKGIWEIKLSNVIIFCHCNADIKSDLSWKNMSGNFKWDRICRRGMESIMLLRKKKQGNS